MRSTYSWIAASVITLACGLAIWTYFRENKKLKPIDELRIRITSSMKIPDPLKIESTGDWYYLDHISNGLSFFDSGKKQFRPLVAESWVNKEDGSHRFKLRPDAKFHDGTPITVKDVLWTLKRQLIAKTSTHFKLWQYVVGCEKLRTLTDECEGLKAVSEHEIEIRLKIQTESFFLQVASPETGIWAASDMDPKTLALNPTKFSGSYYVASHDENSALLKRNEHSLISQWFPNSPRSIRIKKVALSDIDNALLNRDVDLVVRLYSGARDVDWKKNGIERRTTTASGIVHLYGMGKAEHPPIGKDFINAAWKINRDPVLASAESFLPFATASYGLRSSELTQELPEHTAKKLKVFCPEGYFTKSLLDQLQQAARSVGTEIEYVFAPSSDWFASIDDPRAHEKYDYQLSIYAASERYPAVQLSYLTSPFVSPSIDLKKADVPDLNSEHIEILRDYQKWLLRSRQAIPIYFTVTEFLHQKHIDIGDQPASDAEIELWRVQEK